LLFKKIQHGAGGIAQVVEHWQGRGLGYHQKTKTKKNSTWPFLKGLSVLSDFQKNYKKSIICNVLVMLIAPGVGDIRVMRRGY
jgi:hypothetical protein